MRKTYKYRIYPSKSQQTILNSQLESCRKLYNRFLAEKKNLYEQEGKSISMYAQQAELPELKIKYPDLLNVHSQVLQDVATRIDLAFKAFFRRVRNGETPGYPRFKSYGRYDSLNYKQYGNGVKLIDGALRLSGIGYVKIKLHSQLEGTPKTVTIKRSSTGKWHATFSCEIEKPELLPKSDLNVGIDVGLETFVYMSNDTKIENPRFFKQEEKQLAKAQRKLDKVSVKDKNGKVLNPKATERIKAKKVVSRVHERVNFKRQNFAHQESRNIINKYQIIAVEDLNVNQMKEHSFKCLKKSISDASWSSFFSLLHVKAEWAGRTIIDVNPAYTSQDCSNCGHRVKKSLRDRIHTCPCCGLTINRDLNASINILRIGLDSLGQIPRSSFL